MKFLAEADCPKHTRVGQSGYSDLSKQPGIPIGNNTELESTTVFLAKSVPGFRGIRHPSIEGVTESLNKGLGRSPRAAKGRFYFLGLSI
jgi:hypothetical protein